MTITTGVLMLVIVFLAWRMKGAQMGHVVLGALLMKSAASGSIVDTLAASGLNVVNTVVNSVAQALGQGQIV